LNSDHNEIRLLSILPADEGHGVSCSLEHVSLINPPEYVALSYCWGDAAVRKEIRINEESVQVTSNLESALRHLRSKGYKRLWIDAVCINQKDGFEKSHQLLWMGSIYRRAKEVVAWAGDETSDFSKALEFIDSPWDILQERNEVPPAEPTGFFYDSEYVDYPWAFPSLRAASENAKRKEKELSTPKPVPETFETPPIEKLRAFRAFLDRPYWRRVWIIQELALARYSSIHCGSHTIDWLRLKKVLEKCSTATKSSLMHSQITSPEFVNAQNLAQFHTDISNGRPLKFLEAIQRSLGSLSTEPRDKVFALLSLVYDGGHFIPVPNYRQSLESVCVSITVSGISSLSTLDFVAMLGCGVGSNAGLPTWVPNWLDLDSTLSYKALEYLLRSKARGMNVKPSDGFLNSAGGNLPPVFSINSATLLAKGFIFDNIRMLSPTLKEVSNNRLTKIDPSESASVGWGNPYGTEYELLDAIARTWTMYAKRDIRHRRDVVLNLVFDFWTRDPKFAGFTDHLKAWLLGMKPFAVGDFTIQELANRLLPPPPVELANTTLPEDTVEDSRQSRQQLAQQNADYLYELLQAVEEALSDGMRFMTTSDGYVGWAHARARIDDKICILQGCSVPAILRSRAEGGYFLVGNGYVEDIMKGEALIGLQEHDWEEIEIH
jgi:hypothetical protein